MTRSSLIFPADAEQLLASRIRELRLAQGWTRETLAERAGVTVASLKRFERTGKSSLDLLLKVAATLGRLSDFEGVLRPAEYGTLSELELRSQEKRRQRGVR